MGLSVSTCPPSTRTVAPKTRGVTRRCSWLRARLFGRADPTLPPPPPSQHSCPPAPCRPSDTAQSLPAGPAPHVAGRLGRRLEREAAGGEGRVAGDGRRRGRDLCARRAGPRPRRRGGARRHAASHPPRLVDPLQRGAHLVFELRRDARGGLEGGRRRARRAGRRGGDELGRRQGGGARELGARRRLAGGRGVRGGGRGGRGGRGGGRAAAKPSPKPPPPGLPGLARASTAGCGSTAAGMPPGLLPPPATGGRSAPDRSVRKEAGERGAAKGRPAVAAGGAERDWGAVRRG
mmetsp:Transcript_45236/g.143748  ORF Transcript_45236/g.143748 Transcript_45236/m.143748 type:complete len:291 (-) Transcript_45236:62-934(-)